MLNLLIPQEILMVFLFSLGASVGSFLNVVAYRLPEGLSLVLPGSFCPVCKQPIGWYDNIPIISWFVLRGRCRGCRADFSIQYPLVEFLTAVLFLGFYWLYFVEGVRGDMPAIEQGGWLILSMIWPYVLDVEADRLWRLVPYATAKISAVAIGAVLGLVVGLGMLKFGVIKYSFAKLRALEEEESAESTGEIFQPHEELGINVRLEMLWEIAFLTPAVVLGLIFMAILTGDSEVGRWWSAIILEQKWLAGLLGSVFGFMIGGAVVWATRILGSLGFGKEAMGLGDVHLMAAVGAVLGWCSPLLAFFVAPFFGLGWALARLVIHRKREIPYGPFLSMGTLVVMVLHDHIVDYFAQAFNTLPGGGY